MDWVDAVKLTEDLERLKKADPEGFRTVEERIRELRGEVQAAGNTGALERQV